MEPSPLLDALIGHVGGLEIALVDPDRRCRVARGRRLDGAAGQAVADLFAASWASPVLVAFERAAFGSPARGELTDPDGRRLRYTATAWPPEPGAVLLTLQDVTATREVQQRLAAARGRFDAAFDGSPVAMTLLGPDLVPLATNAAAAELSGSARAGRARGRLFDYLEPSELAALLSAAQSLVRGERSSLSVEHTLVRADGQRLRVRSHLRPVTLDDGRPGAIAHHVDISSEAGLADELRRLTVDDPLTGVLNRTGLEAALTGATTRDGAADAPMTLLLADVDDFARVNDILGATEADLVLREVAEALRDTVRDTDAIARVGGDEFALLLPGLDVDRAGTVAESVMERLSANLTRRGGDAALLDLTLSIGITSVTRHTSLETALAGAGIAVYAAKQAGKGRWMAGL